MPVNAIASELEGGIPVRLEGIESLERPPGEAGEAIFGASLGRAVDSLNELQSRADDLSTRAATGDLADIHEALIAMQEASLSLHFATQVRNKVIEAYQEIMRMQV